MEIHIQKELRKVADKDKAKILARFFKTGKGEYGEGDKFLGVVVPEQRRIAKKYLSQTVRSEAFVRSRFSRSQMRLRTKLRDSQDDLQKLLQSEYHEDRLTALLVLVELYKSIDDKINSRKIFLFYLKNLLRINNWDLVDLSAPNIIGDYILNNFTKFQTKNFLLKLARSKNLWSRRVAVLATFPFIKNGQFEEILYLTQFLIFNKKEKHDLIHKALGWMLRELGKKDLAVLQKFLGQYYLKLPRVTLRYAIERMRESERKKYLAKPKSLAN